MKSYIIKYENQNFLGEKTYTKVGISINTNENKIFIEQLAGAKMVSDTFFIPLMIREIRNEIRKFLQSYKRVESFRILEDSGCSGRVDFKLETCKITEGGFIKDKKERFTLHISSNDKLNEDVGGIYLGDYIEMIIHLLSYFENGDKFKDLIAFYGTRKAKRFSKDFLKSNFKKLKILKIKEKNIKEEWCNPNQAFSLEDVVPF